MKKNKGYYELQNKKDKWEYTLKDAKNKEEQTATDIRNCVNRIVDLEQQLGDEKKKRDQLNNLLELSKKETEEAEDTMNDIQKQIKEFAFVDTASIKTEIEQVRKGNEWLIELKTKKAIYDEDVKKAEDLRSQRKEADGVVKSYEEKQNKLLEAIQTAYQLKVEDWVMKVSIDNQRIPIDELNTATQIDLAIDIILAWPNKIKILTIENANSLDPNTMERVKKKIEDAKWQCFLETVYQTGYESITIKDWEVI